MPQLRVCQQQTSQSTFRILLRQDALQATLLPLQEPQIQNERQRYKHIMKILRYIKRLFRVQYRLTAIIHGKAVNTYLTSGRLAKRMLRYKQDAEYWSLYKRGPFGLPEREISKGMKGEKA